MTFEFAETAHDRITRTLPPDHTSCAASSRIVPLMPHALANGIRDAELLNIISHAIDAALAEERWAIARSVDDLVVHGMSPQTIARVLRERAQGVGDWVPR